MKYTVWEGQGGTRVLIPTAYGVTPEPKRPPISRVWTLEEWISAFQARNGDQAARGLRRLVERWRTNSQDGFRAVAEPGVGNNVAFHMYLEEQTGKWAPALQVKMTRLIMPTEHLRKRQWISGETSRRYLEGLAAAVGEAVDVGALEGQLRLSVESLAQADRVESMADVLDDWATELMRVW